MVQCILPIALAMLFELFDHLSVEHKTIRSCADRLHSFHVRSIHDRHLILFTYGGCSWPSSAVYTCGLPFDDPGEALPSRHQQASSIFVDILASRYKVRCFLVPGIIEAELPLQALVVVEGRPQAASIRATNSDALAPMGRIVI